MVVAGINIQQLFILKEISVWWLLPIFLSWLFIFLSKIKISFIHIILGYFSLNYIGILVYSYSYNFFYPTYIFAIGMVVYSLSIMVISYLGKYYKYNFPANNILITNRKNTYMLSILLGFLVIFLISSLLFIKGGIPLFSPDANEKRFTIANGAGLFARMLKFGLTFSLILIAVYFYTFKNSNKKIKYLYFFSIVITITYFIFLGNKGALLGVFIILFVIYTTFYESPKRFTKNLLFLTVFLIMSFIAAIFIASKILSISLEESFWLIMYRATVMAGMGFFQMVHDFVPVKGFQYGLGHLNGFYDLLATFRIMPRGEHTFLGLELSYFMAGLPVDTSIFVYPITITIFADFYYEFGLIGIVAGSILFAYFSLWIYKQVKTSKNLFTKSFFLYLQVFAISVASKGSIMGCINNELISTLVAFCIYIIIYQLLKKIRKEPYRL